MWDVIVLWDEDNEAHVAEHGLTPEEVEEVVRDPNGRTRESRSTGRPCRFGWTSTGKHIIVVWDVANDDPAMIWPVTAYEVPPPAGG